MTGRYQQRCAWVPNSELTPLFRKQRSENLKQRWADELLELHRKWIEEVGNK